MTASYLPDGGGIARYVHALAHARRAGSCTVLAPTSRGRTHVEVSEGVRIVRVSRQWVVHSEPTGNVALGMLPRLRGLSGHGRLVHAHLPFPALLGFAPFARRGTPWVVTYHNEIQGSLGVPAAIRAVHDRLLRGMLVRARAIVVTTADYAAACPTLAPFRSKVRVVPYGIDAEAFARRAREAGVERRTDLLLYVGRLAYYKGLDVLLRALVKVPGARLLVVGEGPEGHTLRRLAGELGVACRVEWRGHVPDAELPGLYSSAAALVLPSTGLSESFGIVQLEAHACGTPVVCSDLPGVREVNPDGVTGLHARPGDAEDLSRALRLLLANAVLRARLGEQAARLVRERFSVQRMLEGIEAVYNEF
ncbi:MAG TPA: glycosyltransferase [Chloroflexia bacterium]|nr:glycosyltransferase [Chloroflexia bacterium]